MTEQRPDKLHHPGKIKRKSECVCVLGEEGGEGERERKKEGGGGRLMALICMCFKRVMK